MAWKITYGTEQAKKKPTTRYILMGRYCISRGSDHAFIYISRNCDAEESCNGKRDIMGWKMRFVWCVWFIPVGTGWNVRFGWVMKSLLSRSILIDFWSVLEGCQVHFSWNGNVWSLFLMTNIHPGSLFRFRRQRWIRELNKSQITDNSY